MARKLEEMSNKEKAVTAVGKFLMDLSHAKNAEQVKAAIVTLKQKLQNLLGGQVTDASKKGQHTPTELTE